MLQDVKRGDPMLVSTKMEDKNPILMVVAEDEREMPLREDVEGEVLEYQHRMAGRNNITLLGKERHPLYLGTDRKRPRVLQEGHGCGPEQPPSRIRPTTAAATRCGKPRRRRTDYHLTRGRYG